MTIRPSRRGVVASMAAAAAMPAQTRESYWAINQKRIDQHDDGVTALLRRQTTDAASPWRGGLPDLDGLHHGGSATALLVHYVAALLDAKSRFHKSGELMDRLKLALGFLDRKTTPDGNLELLSTNFNSPPDTSFAMYNVAGAIKIARGRGAREIEALIEPLCQRHAKGLVKGGVHTPNHRWVMCAALAQVNSLYPDAAYIRRLDQWLAEGIDIDEDGMYSERSTGGYNGIVNRALTVTATLLKRPHLLDPVRRNIDSMLYLLHPGHEPVTEMSRRQDQNTRGSLSGYWFALRHLAITDNNGVYETLARLFEPGITEFLVHPELQAAGPEPAPVVDNYEKYFANMKVARVRRGLTSATMMLEGNSRFFSVRRGEAIVAAVRFASAFFGKAQFVPTASRKEAAAWVLTQEQEAGYYQPIGKPQPWGVDAWYAMRDQRERTEVCQQTRRATIVETKTGFRLRIQVDGTRDVPVAIEVSLAGQGRLEGCEKAPRTADAWLLPSGAKASWRVGDDVVRFGPGRMDNTYTDVRLAEPKLPGQSVYLTGYTPFDHTIEFECS